MAEAPIFSQALKAYLKAIDRIIGTRVTNDSWSRYAYLSAWTDLISAAEELERRLDLLTGTAETRDIKTEAPEE